MWYDTNMCVRDMYIIHNMSCFYPHCAGSASTKYALFAVVNHVGTDHFGHYTAWCKNNLEWNKFNDSM